MQFLPCATWALTSEASWSVCSGLRASSMMSEPAMFGCGLGGRRWIWFCVSQYLFTCTARVPYTSVRVRTPYTLNRRTHVYGDVRIRYVAVHVHVPPVHVYWFF